MYWDSQDDPYDDYDPVRPGIWDDDDDCSDYYELDL